MCDEDNYEAPTLRGWLAYRWLRVRVWFRYRVLGRPRIAVSVQSVDDMFRDHYTPEMVDRIVERPAPLWSALEKWIPPAGQPQPPRYTRIDLEDAFTRGEPMKLGAKRTCSVCSFEWYGGAQSICPYEDCGAHAPATEEVR